MKNILTTIFSLICFVGLQAQITLNVSGTVLNNDGEPVANHLVYIFSDSSDVINNFFYSEEFTDNAGNYSASFDLSENASQGIVYISTQVCVNEWSNLNFSWFPGNMDIIANFETCNFDQQNCSAYIESSPNSLGFAAVMENGTAPFTYEWNNGEFTESIIPDVDNSEYCVTVTDANGCASSDCYWYTDPNGGGSDTLCWAVIYEEPNPAGTILGVEVEGTAPFTYVWWSGETTPEIIVSQNGEYCVAVQDATGCETVSCYYFTGNNGGNDTICSVNIYAEPMNGFVDLAANVQGTAPFTFEWSTGQTTSEIIAQQFGQYCVTITDATACSSSDCYFFSDPNGGGDTICWSSIYIQNTAAGANLGVEVEGTAPFTFEWTTGELTQEIFVTETGEYCVTTTDANGCTTFFCYYYEGNGGGNDSLNYVIRGTVVPNDSIFSNGENISARVYLIQYMEQTETLLAIDSVEVSITPINAILYYDFGYRPAGVYRTKAALLADSDFYETTLPTYHLNYLYWDVATEIVIPSNTFAEYPIIMQQGENPGGPGFIGGLVTEGANFQGGSSNNFVGAVEGDPVKGVTIFLFDEVGNAIAYDYTDEEGQYDFPDLAWGTYKIVVELLNYEQFERWVTIGSDLSTPTDIDFTINSTEISTSTNEVAETTNLNVYPNPTSNILNIQVNSQVNRTLQLFLTDITGKEMRNEKINLTLGTQFINLNVNDFPAGLYFINMSDGKSFVTGKFVKK